MNQPNCTDSSFEATLRRPAQLQGDGEWAFVILPKSVSDRFPRRGRTSVQGTINGQPFQGTLEPDGQLSHWLKLPQELLESSGTGAGRVAVFDLSPLTPELEPALPHDFEQALAASPGAKATWDATTTVARVDWVHWMTSAKQDKTRLKRVADACAMLASGEKRVCCFDSSGYYSKSFSPPREAE